MKTDTKNLVTWGRHPAHGFIWLKLCAGNWRSYNSGRLREGWELAIRVKGEKP